MFYVKMTVDSLPYICYNDMSYKSTVIITLPYICYWCVLQKYSNYHFTVHLLLMCSTKVQ